MGYDLDNLGEGMCVIGRANQMGLGTMTDEFCAAFNPESVLIVDYSPEQKLDISGLKNVTVVPRKSMEDSDLLAQLLRGLDIVVGFETYYNDELPQIARSHGMTSVMFPMWEWSPESVIHSDLLVCLSEHDLNHYGPKSSIRFDWPASPAVHEANRVINWPPKTFVHPAGNAWHNRDGTRETLSAATHLRDTPAKLLVYHSFEIKGHFWYDDKTTELCGSAKGRDGLLKGADCVVSPRRLPGHSLPINEAGGEGIATIVLDLPDWNMWPYRVRTYPSSPFTCNRGSQPLQAWEANPAELGQLMRDMALGLIDYEEGPVFPTWEEFKAAWAKWLIGARR